MLCGSPFTMDKELDLVQRKTMPEFVSCVDGTLKD